MNFFYISTFYKQLTLTKPTAKELSQERKSSFKTLKIIVGAVRKEQKRNRRITQQLSEDANVWADVNVPIDMF